MAKQDDISTLIGVRHYFALHRQPRAVTGQTEPRRHRDRDVPVGVISDILTATVGA